MTRWARSGSTQKHKKMPGDATSWEEFSTAEKLKSASGSNGKQILKGRIEKKKHNLKRKGDSKESAKPFDFQSSKANEVKDLVVNEASKSKFPKKKKLSHLLENEGFDDAIDCSSPVDESDESKKLDTNVEEENISASPVIENYSTLTKKGLTKRQLQKANRKMKLITLDIMRSTMYDQEVEKNKESEFSADNNASTDNIPRDESTHMEQHFVAENNYLDNGSNYAPTTKVLTKRQLKKAKSKMKLLALDMLRSGKYDNEVADSEEIANVTENHNSSPTAFLEKKEILNPKRNQEEMYENTVDISLDEDNVKIMDQEDQIQEKSTNSSVQALSDNVLSKNETSKCDDTTEVKRLTKNQWRKARIRKKFELLKAMQASEGKEIKPENQTDKKPHTPTSKKDLAVKKKVVSEKLEGKKLYEKTLLPSDVESKLSDLKNTLREKGLSAKKVRDIVRKERKREKLKFKRTFNNKPCFNCRKIGHFLSDCPLPLGDSTQVTGVCFKCGSTEHTSYKCQKRVEGYPLAKCFICKEQGHISKDCPKNEHGVYINGGKCSLCGNVNHLSKDCPSNKKEKDNTMTVDTINAEISVDAEIIEPVSIPKKNFQKKKIVKF